MLYLMGLGLNEKGISVDGLEVLKRCSLVYLESYTVDFPYSIEKLEKIIDKKIIKLKREEVEGERLVREAKKEDVCLLIYGSPLFATTHTTLLLDCAKAKVKTHVIYSASVFDAIAFCGLELYKFGKISSMPKWQKNYTPDSFLDYVIENKKINAHSLILVDIGLEFSDALNELEISIKNKGIKINNLIVCSSLGTDKQVIFYGDIKEIKTKKIISPFCFIIPGELHFLEKEALERFEI